MLLKINKLYLMTEVYSNTYKTDCLQAGILLTKRGSLFSSREFDMK